jgi:chromosome partitioning protein
MKIITCYNLKGGVGKTTINNLLALEIAQTKIIENGEERESKVLLIDADEQANLTSFFYNNIHKDKTIIDALVNDLNAEDIIIKSPNIEYKNVDFIPCNLRASVAIEYIANKNAREKVATRWFVKNLEVLQRYDYIVIDLSPGTNILNRNFLYLSDLILGIVKHTDIASLEGFSVFLERYKKDIEELELPRSAEIRVLLNNYTNKDTTTARIFNAYMNEFNDIKELMLESKISDSVAIKNAIIYRKSLRDYVEQQRINNKALLELQSVIKELF